MRNAFEVNLVKTANHAKYDPKPETCGKKVRSSEAKTKKIWTKIS